jgi:hypothetical protein
MNLGSPERIPPAPTAPAPTVRGRAPRTLDDIADAAIAAQRARGAWVAPSAARVREQADDAAWLVRMLTARRAPPQRLVARPRARAPRRTPARAAIARDDSDEPPGARVLIEYAADDDPATVERVVAALAALLEVAP